MKDVNDYSGRSDNERIEAAIRDRSCQTVILRRRVSDIEPERDWWRLDRAILLPSNTTVILRDCKLKLSDTCRDNFFRSANCGLGIEEPEPVENIHIIGQGSCVLEGADHPRATGDGSKILGCPCPKNFTGAKPPGFEDLHRHSYGTDAGKAEESQRGDWRNIGILMANVTHLSIENLRIRESHAWAISLESCAYADIRRIEFQARMTRHIDGADQNVENQDGINLRAGCHDVLISDITGMTGDDVVALTATASQTRRRRGGELKSTQVMGNDFSSRSKNISNVIIRNVMAYPAGGCLMLRLLALDGAEIRNVTVDGIVDASPDDFHTFASVQIGEKAQIVGEPNHPYGKQHECSIFNVTFSNIISNAKMAVYIPGGLRGAAFCNVISRNPEGKPFELQSPELIHDVQFQNVQDWRLIK